MGQGSKAKRRNVTKDSWLISNGAGIGTHVCSRLSPHSFPYTCRILNLNTHSYLLLEKNLERIWRKKEQELMTRGQGSRIWSCPPFAIGARDSSCFWTDSWGVYGGQTRMWGGRERKKLSASTGSAPKWAATSLQLPLRWRQEGMRLACHRVFFN